MAVHRLVMIACTQTLVALQEKQIEKEECFISPFLSFFLAQ